MNYSKEDWGARYLAKDTPWNHGDPHPEVRRLIAAGEFPFPESGNRVLVPGCGPAHDARAIAEEGYEVTGVDFSEEVTPLATATLNGCGGKFLCEDALAHDPKEPYDLVFEHTFLCAIDPSLRPRYAEMISRVLRPGGLLAIIVFPVDRPREEEGPPSTLTIDDLTELLAGSFVLRSHAAVQSGRAGREWVEEFAVFERS
ncbi:MAG: methyltransferase domain-containing protein [Planctomycetota bacterium]|jgi:SAM-dependent methyltransferase|nr:methyltransferase domain-containing protein [Planctomycetota bacterium]